MENIDLTTPATRTVVFAPDDQTLNGIAKVLRYLAGAEAVGKLAHPVALGTGWWQGDQETVVAMNVDEFYRLNMQRSFAAKQECVFVANPDGSAELHDYSGDDCRIRTTAIGRVHRLDKVEPAGCTVLGGIIYGTIPDPSDE